jgi:hypothetical protein
MSWFQLDPESVVQRVQASGRPPEIRGPGTFIRRGIVGFTILSIAGFAPWAVFGRWFYRAIGEAGLYAVCALVFIALSGPLMHRLIIGPGSLSRFYKLFSITFTVNSILWIAGWFAFRKYWHGHVGSLVGLLAGTAAMGWMLARAFDAKGVTLKVIAALFILNTVGYFVGGWAEGAVAGMKQLSLFGQTFPRSARMILAKSLWGVFYGIGFGAGLGLAFYYCQERTRAALQELKMERAP